MGDKSVQKKKYIIEKARGVFHKRGYRAVTMKDIVEACDISRGGLYLYFSSTKELFEEILRQDNEAAYDVIEAARKKKSSPGEIMLIYLNEQKKEILKKKDNLSIATYEYLFENKSIDSENLFKTDFEKNVSALEQLIADGVEQEWMVCDEPASAAKNIAFTLEGLKVASQTIGVSAEVMDKEIEYIMSTLGMVVE